MLFNSYSFLLFFPIVVLLYFVIPKKTRYIWLLVASYYFYMSWNVKYVLLILFSTIVTWLSGLLIEKNSNKKKLIVILCLSSNLLILAFFKYFGFLLETLNSILGIVHVTAINNPFDLLLPVGISFYTFQALSYTIDIYRGEIEAEKNFFRYALFVSFFPQLVAGPIERSGNLLNQLRRTEEIKLWNYDRITDGLKLMLFGYFQKMVLADRISIFVDTVYGKWWMYGGTELVLATVLFAFQIYCDFNGYTLIAIGAAKVMGFDLMENFNTPYLAMSIKEFWRRWHISLSTWFRDYVYIPLGGSRCSKLKRYRNIIITFLLSGLWHGANWTFVIWGLLHGVYQIIGEFLMPRLEAFQNKIGISTKTFSLKFGKVLGTFILVDFAWIFFRAKSIGDAFGIIKRIFVNQNLYVLSDQSLYTLGLNYNEMHILIAALAILIIVDLLKYRTGKGINAVLTEQGIVFRWVICSLLLLSIIIFGVYGPDYSEISFLYFQF